MKALVGAFNQEKALVGAFSVIVQPVVEPMDRFAALDRNAVSGLVPAHAHTALVPIIGATLTIITQFLAANRRLIP